MRVFEGFLKAMKRRMKVRKSIENRVFGGFSMVFYGFESISFGFFFCFEVFFGFFCVFFGEKGRKMVKKGGIRGVFVQFCVFFG